MSPAPAVWLAWLTVGERAVRVVRSIFRRKPRKPKPPADPTATAPVTPMRDRYRPRPPAPTLGAMPTAGDGSTLAVVAGVVAVLSVCALLVGCNMTNDEVIAEAAKCRAAGMRADVVRDGMTWEVRKIVCLPIEEKTP